MKEIKISLLEISNWLNTLRKLKTNSEKNRFLESLWESQIKSKLWLINQVNNCIIGPQNIYVFGGWTGMLSNLLFQYAKFEILKIRSIDIDPWCEQIAQDVNANYSSENLFKSITSNMATYEYEKDNNKLVINTSSEHVNQATYDLWYELVPKNSIVVVQSNNMFNHHEHIRCSSTLGDFKKINHVSNELFSNELILDNFTRYMAIWIKS